MDTLTLRWPWWPMRRLFSRNPLVRGADRLEAVVVLMAVAVSLIALPFAAAVGTAVHDSRNRVYAQQAQSRHPVTATVTDVSVIGDEPDIAATADTPAPPRRTITVPARWIVGGMEHRGVVSAAPTVLPGDRVGIWVDNDGHQVREPAPVSRAGTDAVLAALGIWLSVIAAAAVAAALTRAVLNQVRTAGWQHDIDNLLCRPG